jgi:neurotransmitter:Na+ symporter, NSS family
MSSTKTGERWSSRWAFILATTGAAVGLGNIWRFPYMAGNYGGSAFVIIYLLCVALIALPVLISEIILGRHGRKNPVDSLADIAKENNHSTKWKFLGWWGLLALILVLSFYSVVSGWSIAYFIKSISGQFNQMTPDQVGQTWGNFLSNPWRLLSWNTAFMVLTIGIVIRGISKGIEKATHIMMPILYLILISLVIFSCVTGDAHKAFSYLFAFKLSDVTPTIVIAAMGHAFFTLAVGAGAMLMYGAYAPKNINIVSTVLIVTVLDIAVAILAGLAIFPLVFAYNLEPTSGPGLMFITLPIAFAKMHFGNIVGAGFFLLLFFASLTSSINLAEPVIVTLINKLQISRKKAALITGAAAWFLGVFSILSFNQWKNIKLLHQTLFDLISNATTDIFLPIGGLGFAIVAGYIMKKTQSQDELAASGHKVYSLWRFLIRYVAPIGIVIVLISAFV